METTRSPIVAALLSTVVPGLGQLYNAEVAKGLALVVAALGIMAGSLASTSSLGYGIMALAYLALLVPTVVDAFQVAKGNPRRFAGDSIGYILVMMLFIGPFALPLLWQSKKFSGRAKILWTLGVILFALLAIVAISYLGSVVDQMTLNQKL